MTDAPVSVTITQLILAALPMTLAAVASFVTSLRNHSATRLAAVKAVEAKEAAEQTTDKIDQISVTINGRLSELLDTLKQNALTNSASQRALGIMEGRELEREKNLEREKDKNSSTPNG